MNILKKTALLCVLFIPVTIKPIVNYVLLVRGEQRILLLGDNHDPRLNALHAFHARMLIKDIFKRKNLWVAYKKAVNCFIELPKDKTILGQKNGSRKLFLGKTFEVISEYAQTKPRHIRFIPCDDRRKDSIALTLINRIITSSLNKTFETLDKLIQEIEPLVSGYPVCKFYQDLNSYCSAITTWFGPDSIHAVKFENFKKRAYEFFARTDPKIEFALAIRTIFNKSVDKLRDEPNGVNANYQTLTEFLDCLHTWFDLSVFQQSLPSINIDKDSRILFIVGGGHLEPLTNLFIKEGFVLVKQSDGFDDKFLEFDANGALHDKYAQEVVNITELFLGVTNTLPVFPIKTDTNCKTKESPTAAGKSTITLDEINKAISKLAVTQNKESQQAAIQLSEKNCNSCKKAESANQKLKCCGKCKVVWYCSVECQKADWKLHKLACAKPVAAANATTAAGTTSESAKATSNSSDGKSTTISNSGKYLVVSKK